MESPSEDVTGSTPERGDAGKASDAGAPEGGWKAGSGWSIFERLYGKGAPTSGGDEQPAKQAGADGPPAELVQELFGGLGAVPFDMAALKTGHAHWELTEKQRQIMALVVENAASAKGINVNPKTNPIGILGLAYFALGFPRVVQELVLIRQELQKKNGG